MFLQLGVLFFSWVSLSDSLPELVPADIVQKEKLVEFQTLSEEVARELRKGRNYARAPVGSQILLDGKPLEIRYSKNFEPFFLEKHFAGIPAKSFIGVSQLSDGREVWVYPPGFLVAHEIFVRTEPPKLLELRVIRKLAAGGWEYGTYVPSDKPEVLRLLNLVKYPENAEASFELPSKQQLDITRVRMQTCQHCHLGNSTADYQYRKYDRQGKLDIPASVEETGPCGFVPTNPFVKLHWAPAVHAATGMSPFQALPHSSFF